EEGTDAALIAIRPVEFGVLGGRIDTPIFDRARLAAGHRIKGPALIQEYASTTVVAPGDSLTVDRFGNLDIAVDADRVMSQQTTSADPIITEIVRNGFVAATEEMKTNLMR